MKAVSRSYINFSDSSDDSPRHDTKVSKENLSTVKKGSKKEHQNTKGESSNKKKNQSTEKKARLKSSKSKKGDLSMCEAEKRVIEKQIQNLENKRASLKPLKNQDIITSTNVIKKQLDEDYHLKVKVNSLQKSIASQEKILKDLHKKLVNEKSDLSDLKKHIVKKVQKEKVKEEMYQEKPPLGAAQVEGREKTHQKRLSVASKKLETAAFPQKENEPGAEGVNTLMMDSVRQNLNRDYQNYFSEKVDSGLREKTNELLERELDRKGEDAVFQRKRINEMKTYMKDLTRKYEVEIDNLKAEIQILNEENFRIRKMSSAKDYEKIEDLYSKRIRELEEAVAQKDREIAEKEGYYKGQIEDINMKMEELQKEVRKMGDYEGQVQELTQQLQLKEKEMQMTKKYYMEKLQARVEEQQRQKKEWAVTYNNLLQEIRSLKGEVDYLGYENRKLNSNNSSSIRLKEESTYFSSRRAFYDS